MPTFTADQLAQIALVIAAVGSAGLSWYNAARSAKKEEVELLREEVCSLRAQLADELNYRLRLVSYVGELLFLMRRAGLTPPPIPEDLPDIEIRDPRKGRRETKEIE